MKHLLLLFALLLIFLSGCYTQLVTYQTTDTTSPAPVTVYGDLPSYDMDLYAGYNFGYSWSYGYSPYWYSGFYTAWHNPYRAYMFLPHKIRVTPYWRIPFRYTPPRHFGTNWDYVQPTNPPRFVKPISRPNGPTRREPNEIRNAIIKQDNRNPYHYTPNAQREQRQESSHNPSTYTPNSQQQHSNYNAPQKENTNRSSGATRTGKR